MQSLDFSSLYTEKAYALDIRAFKEHGAELSKAITQAVKDTQSAVIRAMPSRIIMTVKQYNDLNGTPQFQKMYDVTGELLQENHLYRTPMNVMEVEVK